MTGRATDATQDDLSAQGPYDGQPGGDDDLWFLPGPDEDGAKDAKAPPLPQADRTALIRPEVWHKAEATHAALLARVAALFGALDERLRHAPEGWHHRLALLEAAAISWRAGDRVTAERLALWQALRLTGGHEDGLALSRAGWAARRLQQGGRLQAGSEDAMLIFLGRQEGDDLSGRLADWADAMAKAGDLHPFTRAAFGRDLWLLADLSRGLVVAENAGQAIEASVVAARLAAIEARGGAIFLPIGQGALLPNSGAVVDRLARWLRAAEQGCLAALMHLDRIEHWQGRATAAIADLSGRTPMLMMQVLRDWPLVSAPMAEAQSPASRAAVQRNLALMQARGLIREVTGQGRYRFWTAAL